MRISGSRMRQFLAANLHFKRLMPKNGSFPVPMDSDGYCDILFPGNPEFPEGKGLGNR